MRETANDILGNTLYVGDKVVTNVKNYADLTIGHVERFTEKCIFVIYPGNVTKRCTKWQVVKVFKEGE